MQAEIANLKQAVTQQQSLQFSATRSRNHSRSASRPNYSRRGCSSCTAQNRQSQCHHCFLCGSADHIMSECKLRESKPSGKLKMAATEGRGLAATENNVNKSHSCNNCGKVEKGRKFK